MQTIKHFKPHDYDEKVQAVPRFTKVTDFSPNSHRTHFNEHLDCEEG